MVPVITLCFICLNQCRMLLAHGDFKDVVNVRILSTHNCLTNIPNFPMPLTCKNCCVWVQSAQNAGQECSFVSSLPFPSPLSTYRLSLFLITSMPILLITVNSAGNYYYNYLIE